MAEWAGCREWRPVPWDSRYMVSCHGEVWSNVTGREIGTNKDRPYRRVCRVPIHRLVATAFHGEPPDGAVCRHLNDDPLDNRAANLAWGTPADNAADWGRNTGRRGANARMGIDDVRAIRAHRADGMSYRDIADAVGVTYSQVAGVLTGDTWAWVDAGHATTMRSSRAPAKRTEFDVEHVVRRIRMRADRG